MALEVGRPRCLSWQRCRRRPAAKYAGRAYSKPGLGPTARQPGHRSPAFEVVDSLGLWRLPRALALWYARGCLVYCVDEALASAP